MYALSPSTEAGILILLAFAFLVVIYMRLTLRPKNYYIVRHGRTLLNEQHIKQGADGALSEKGIAQAEALGTAMSTFKVRAITASPYERAAQTAEIINTHLKVPVLPSPLLAERRNPKEVIGKKTNDPEVERITGLIEKGFHEDTYRFSDEENFEDMVARARACRTFLERLPYRRVCVVTHHAFLQVFLSYLLYSDELTAKTYATLAFFNPAENAGITICTYRPWRKWTTPTHGWEIVAYNYVLQAEGVEHPAA